MDNELHQLNRVYPTDIHKEGSCTRNYLVSLTTSVSTNQNYANFMYYVGKQNFFHLNQTPFAQIFQYIFKSYSQIEINTTLT
jgi:hypothetical protein